LVDWKAVQKVWSWGQMLAAQMAVQMVFGLAVQKERKKAMLMA
jgi:hypothetical protein